MESKSTKGSDSEVMRGAEIDASGLYYKELNARLRRLVDGEGASRVVLRKVCGQRYIGTDLERPAEIEVHGTPGNDLAAFLGGQRIVVWGNAQDGVGNTMNDGEVVVHGHAGDILGMSMRGGNIYVRDSVGYRVGIHMKEYGEKVPVLVIGGTAQDFLGEYMAGGRIILLGLNLGEGERHRSCFVGTGMHGGAIYLRGEIEARQLGKEVGAVHPGEPAWGEEDWAFLRRHVGRYVEYFGGDTERILSGPLLKLYGKHLRPYGNLYSFRN